jgi:hypothetical protein
MLIQVLFHSLKRSVSSETASPRQVNLRSSEEDQYAEDTLLPFLLEGEVRRGKSFPFKYGY